MNRYVLLLLLVTLVWGATFPILKLATAQLSGLEVSTLRFWIAGLVMLPFAWQASSKAWKDGGILGAIVLVSYVTQAYGLEYISSNRSAFLTSLNVLMVPLIGIALGGQPVAIVFVAALMACCGIGMMSWEGEFHLRGDGATVLGAFAYALDVVLLSRWAHRHNARHLAATQVVWMAVLGLVWMLLSSIGTDHLTTLPGRLDGPVVWGLLYLGVVATAGMLILQAIAQRHVNAEKAALVYALEPVFATAFAWWWLGELMTLLAMFGAALVVMAIVLSELPKSRLA